MTEAQRNAYSDMEMQLRMMRARIEYWKEDIALGLKPTEGSMDDAIVAVADCLRRAKDAK